MVDRQALKNFLLGTAVKITTILSIDTATSCVIKIHDPANNVKVNNASMTNDANKVYSYVYQSASTDLSGIYLVTISVTSGSYTSVAQEKFELAEQEPV